MEKSNQRIRILPDEVVQYIFSLMPLKFMVKTCILSRRWRNMWKYIWPDATALDFGAEFVPHANHEEYIATVNQYLQLHKGKEIKMFRLMFNPGMKYLSDVEKWVEFALERRVKELDIDFCQTIKNETGQAVKGSKLSNLPNSLFCCDSIIHLNLSRCNFHLPLNFNGYTNLKTLHLYLVRVTDALLESMLENCPLLEELSLRDCCALNRIKVSASDLPLKRLTVMECSLVTAIEIFAPNLQSFHLYGDLIWMSFKNISSLVDVLLNGIEWECPASGDDWITVLHQLEHVRILTLCDLSLELSKHPSKSNNEWKILAAEDTPVFDHLKAIKMNGFRGILDEMQLVEFFLRKAILLESLVLVAPEKGVSDMEEDSASASKSGDTPLGLLRQKLLILANASSSDAQILVSEYSEDNGALSPTHTEYYHLAKASSSVVKKLKRE